MYRVGAFHLDDPAEVATLVTDRGFGTVVVSIADGFEASPLPWVVDADDRGPMSLRGHVARGNPLTRSLAAGDRPALVIVDVVDGYVSPSWYPSKLEHGRVVPTWNYITVHLHGTLRLVDDPTWVRAVVQQLTERHEAAMPRPWSVDDAPADHLDRMLSAIVGCEFTVGRIEAKIKLSQNRPVDDVDGVIAGLHERADGTALAAAMERNRSR
jgi:transcriptional regulator